MSADRDVQEADCSQQEHEYSSLFSSPGLFCSSSFFQVIEVPYLGRCADLGRNAVITSVLVST
jgi:hypothetical protein